MGDSWPHILPVLDDLTTHHTRHTLFYAPEMSEITTQYLKLRADTSNEAVFKAFVDGRRKLAHNIMSVSNVRCT